MQCRHTSSTKIKVSMGHFRHHVQSLEPSFLPPPPPLLFHANTALYGKLRLARSVLIFGSSSWSPWAPRVFLRVTSERRCTSWARAGGESGESSLRMRASSRLPSMPSNRIHPRASRAGVTCSRRASPGQSVLGLCPCTARVRVHPVSVLSPCPRSVRVRSLPVSALSPCPCSRPVSVLCLCPRSVRVRAQSVSVLCLCPRSAHVRVRRLVPPRAAIGLRPCPAVAPLVSTGN